MLAINDPNKTSTLSDIMVRIAVLNPILAEAKKEHLGVKELYVDFFK